MLYILFIFLLVITALALALFFKVHLIIALPVTISVIIFLLYLQGLFGLLHFAPITFYGLALAGLIYILFSFRARVPEIRAQLVSPGFIIFIVLMLLNYLLNFNRILIYFDEFSHWGLLIKNMYIHRDFGDSVFSTAPAGGSYPPAVSLFLYLFSSLDGIFQERNLFLAFNIVQVSFLLPFLKKFSMDGFRKSLIPALIVISLPLLFYHTIYNSIYVDGLLGILFAFILFTYYSMREPDAFSLIAISSTLFFLVLTKNVGIFFALLAMAIISGDLLFTGKLKNSRKYFLMIIPVLMIALAFFSWEAHPLCGTETSSRVTGFVDSTATRAAAVAATSIIPDYWFSIVKEFIKQIIPYLYFMAGFTLACYLIYSHLAGRLDITPKSLKTFGAGILPGFILYALLLLVNYLINFPVNMALEMSSFNRYMNSFVLGAVLMLSYLLVTVNQDLIRHKKAITVFVLAVVAISLILPLGIGFFGEGHEQYYRVRENLEDTKQFVAFMQMEKDNIYFIAQADRDYIYWLFQFNVTPIRAGRGYGWSISREQNGLYETVEAERWAALLRDNYTFLYLHRVDDVFVQDYGFLFDDPGQIDNRKLFRIEAEKSELLLIPVDRKTGQPF